MRRPGRPCARGDGALPPARPDARPPTAGLRSPHGTPHPPHRCDRLRRRAPAARSLEERGERVRCLSRRPEVPALAASRRRPRSSAGTCSQPETLGPGARGRRHRLLPRPLDELETRRSTRTTGRRPVVRRGSARGRRPPHRLPRRARARAGPLAAPRLAPGGRSDPARVRRPDDRVPGLDRDRLGQRVVRDDPRARREAAGDGDAAVGARAGAADRDRGRARLPARGARPRAGGWASSTRSAEPTASRTSS